MEYKKARLAINGEPRSYSTFINRINSVNSINLLFYTSKPPSYSLTCQPVNLSTC
jgi:hypothetical protein